MTATKQMIHQIAYFSLLVSFSCCTHRALADDFATPTPTPGYLKPLPAGSLRRAERIDRRRAVQSEAQSNAHARAQAKANRSTAAALKTKTREADHAREQAERAVAAEARRETARETPHTNSDLMARMGFTENEVAVQKAREQSGQLGKKEMRNGIIGANHQQETPAPSNTSAAGAPSPAVSQTPTTSAAVPNPNSP